MTALPLRLAWLIPIAGCLVAPVPALAEPDAPPAAIDEDVERSAAMAHRLTATPNAGTEGQSVLLSMAVQGHASSQYLLGLQHLEGAGAARDRGEAVRWLERAASQGHEGALAHLTEMATRGDVAAHLALGLIARDHARGGKAAARHLRAAAAAGDPQGLLALGELYLTAEGLGPDEAHAAVLFRAAAEAAMNAVQLAREEATAGILGPGSDAWLEVAVDRTRAAHADPPGRSATQPEHFAHYWVGLVLLAGAGTSADTPRGLAHHRAAAEQEFDLAEFSLGVLYQRGHGLPRDLGEARRWFARATAHGHPLAGNDYSEQP